MICPLCYNLMKDSRYVIVPTGLTIDHSRRSFMCKMCNLSYSPNKENWLWGPKPYKDVFVYSNEVFQRMLKLKAFW